MSAIRVTAEGIYPKYAGEIQDYFIEWTAQIAPARVTAAARPARGRWPVRRVARLRSTPRRALADRRSA